MVSPIVSATVQAGILSAISNFLAQALQAWEAKTPLSLDTTELYQFALYAVLSCPPNFIWQSYMEAQFPGYTEKLTPKDKERLVDEAVTGRTTGINEKHAEDVIAHRTRSQSAKDTSVSSSTSQPQSSSLNKKNTAIKFALDSTLGIAVNTVMFLVGIGLIRGKSWSQIQHDLNDQCLDMIFAGQKFWPAVSILSLTLVPVQHRTSFGGLVGIFWGIYVSIFTSQRG